MSCVLLALLIVWYPRALHNHAPPLREQMLALKQRLNDTGEPIVVRSWSGVLLIVLAVSLVAFYVNQAWTSPGAGTFVNENVTDEAYWNSYDLVRGAARTALLSATLAY